MAKTIQNKIQGDFIAVKNLNDLHLFFYVYFFLPVTQNEKDT